MVRIENDCVNCDAPCKHCGADRTPHLYCDKCKEEVGTLYYWEGMEYCKDCVIDDLEEVEVN